MACLVNSLNIREHFHIPNPRLSSLKCMCMLSVCVCVCAAVPGFWCVFLAVGVGSVEVRLLLKNALLEKDKERVSISGQLPAREQDHSLSEHSLPGRQDVKCSLTM